MTDQDRSPLPESAYRSDIQGLRAVAVLLVVISHAGLGVLKGGFIGVDTFFVVSGFLITGLLLKDAAGHGSIRFVTFYARRARRILPAAALTLIVTDLAALLFLNVLRAQSTAQDSLWAALFAANIQFQRIGVDYFASAQPPSPVQHFWSLAVEEQYYLVWPALLAGLLLLAAKLRSHLRPPLILATVLLICAASFAWSLYETSLSPATAYFSPFTRAWELGVGSALAIGVSQVARLPVAARVSMSWLGLAGILVAATLITDSTPFPGIAALLPVVSTALVIAGGIGVPRAGAGLVLSVPPMRFIGDLSYSFYLWHWPFLIIGNEHFLTPPGTAWNLLLIGMAFVTSVITYFVFEDPLRRSRRLWSTMSPSRPLVLWPACVGGVALVAAVTLVTVQGPIAVLSTKAAAVGQLVISSPGPTDQLPPVAASVAAAQRGDPLPSNLEPPIAQVANDYYDAPGCIIRTDGVTHNKLCAMADATATRTIVVFGDSHAAMWMPGVLATAKRNGWKVYPLIKIGCTPTAVVPEFRAAQCLDWFHQAVQQLNALDPDLVIVGGYDGFPKGNQDIWERGLKIELDAVKHAGRRVVLFGDSPGVPVQPADCLLTRGATMKTCTFPLAEARAQRLNRGRAIAAANLVDFIDVEPWFCYQQECPIVVGSTVVYYNTDHVSVTYSTELAPFIGRALAIGRSPARPGL
jgi:peptidoglycan/LPS O-acetylase OafA/YrhL